MRLKKFFGLIALSVLLAAALGAQDAQAMALARLQSFEALFEALGAEGSAVVSQIARLEALGTSQDGKLQALSLVEEGQLGGDDALALLGYAALVEPLMKGVDLPPVRIMAIDLLSAMQGQKAAALLLDILRYEREPSLLPLVLEGLSRNPSRDKEAVIDFLLKNAEKFDNRGAFAACQFLRALRQADGSASQADNIWTLLVLERLRMGGPYITAVTRALDELEMKAKSQGIFGALAAGETKESRISKVAEAACQALGVDASGARSAKLLDMAARGSGITAREFALAAETALRARVLVSSQKIWKGLPEPEASTFSKIVERFLAAAKADALLRNPDWTAGVKGDIKALGFMADEAAPALSARARNIIKALEALAREAMGPAMGDSFAESARTPSPMKGSDSPEARKYNQELLPKLRDAFRKDHQEAIDAFTRALKAGG